MLQKDSEDIFRCAFRPWSGKKRDGWLRSELCGKPERKKWKGETAEKATCYESHTVRTDKQGKEKTLQITQVSADPKWERQWEEGKVKLFHLRKPP